jgi:hypothetical protein
MHEDFKGTEFQKKIKLGIIYLPNNLSTVKTDKSTISSE